MRAEILSPKTAEKKTKVTSHRNLLKLFRDACLKRRKNGKKTKMERRRIMMRLRKTP